MTIAVKFNQWLQNRMKYQISLPLLFVDLFLYFAVARAKPHNLHKCHYLWLSLSSKRQCDRHDANG